MVVDVANPSGGVPIETRSPAHKDSREYVLRVLQAEEVSTADTVTIFVTQ